MIDSTALLSAMGTFMNALEEERFYDAHEYLETLWFPRRTTDHDEIWLLKGFINAAVSFELIKRGRPEASQRVWKNFEKYLPRLSKVSRPNRSHYEAGYHKIRARNNFV